MKVNIFNPDFQDFIRALNSSEVDYLLVGGYAVILHGYNRTTGDLDVWVRKTLDNYHRLLKAFARFGMPTFDMTEKNFLHNPALDVFSFGIPPVSIDLMTETKGLNFETAFGQAQWFEFEDFKIRVVQYQDLLDAKAAAGRPKDHEDIRQLQRKK